MRPDADDDRRPLNPDWDAEAYERGRPGWPPRLVDRIFDRLGLGAGSTVLDLAAGTGKLTRVLEQRARVIAVEPHPAMRAVHGSALDGTAESIPLGDASVDAVFVAEAWHWLDAEAALAEVDRVSRGGLALLWNVPRGDTFELGPLRPVVERAATPKKRAYDSGAWRAPVERVAGPLTLLSEDHDHALGADDYVAMVASWSFVTELPGDERRPLLAELRAGLPDRVTVSYRAEAWVSGR